ncbi:hypothetical protein V2S84_22615 [Azotobacter chroococcum]|nr:hypothetical protein [Azotobacter chroococcum]
MKSLLTEPIDPAILEPRRPGLKPPMVAPAPTVRLAAEPLLSERPPQDHRHVQERP